MTGYTIFMKKAALLFMCILCAICCFACKEASDEKAEVNTETASEDSTSVSAENKDISKNEETDSMTTSDKSLKILFIGNSYTYYNDMPQIFEKLATENGKDLEIFSVTKGSRKLCDFMNNDEYTQKLDSLVAEHHFDFCFLQEQSVLPITNYDLFLDGVKHLDEKLSDSVDSVVLYATWARKEGHKTLADLGLTAEEMTSKLHIAYKDAADVIGAGVSPVGLAFENALESGSTELCVNDNSSHPTYAGSCLAALTHYYTVYGEYPEKTSCLGLDDSVLEVFKNAVTKGTKE